MSFVRIARPTVPAITVQQVRENERIAHSLEGDLIARHIAAAEQHIQFRTNRAIMRQKFALRAININPSVTLWYPPMDGEITITAASSVYGGFTTTYDLETLVLGDDSQLPSVGFPSILGIDSGSMRIEYETGVEDPTDVPPDIQQAIVLLASHWYRSREAVVSDTRVMAIDKKVAFGVDALIAPYRIRNINSPYLDDL